MPRILRIFAKKQPIVIEESSLQQLINRFTSLASQHLPSDVTAKASELYANAHIQLTNFTQDKSHGELLFLGSILAAVLLFVVVLPFYEVFCKQETQVTSKQTRRSSAPSSGSSTESLETIEESEEEDIPLDPIEVHASLKFVDEDDEIQVYDDAPFTCQKFGDDDEASDSTPVTVGETPTVSPCVTPLREKPTLNKDVVSNIGKRSSFAKLKGKMSSSLSFRRKESSDVSVASTSSNRSFRVFNVKSKKD